MAPTADEDVLARVQEVRGTDAIKAGDRERLENIKNFFLSNQTDAVQSATHVVLENYPDWWCRGRRAPPGLAFLTGGENDNNLQDELCDAVGTLHTLGIPLTLAERRTPLFRFFQDVEAWGTREGSIPMEELVSPECELTLVLGRAIGEIFPAHGGFLDAAVFDATGFSQTKGVRKTSLRIVWPGLIVDADRAPRVRDLVVHRLTASAAEEGSTLGKLEARLREFSDGAAWHNVFGDAAYAARASVRMPLCDRVSPLPLRAPERRPLSPVGVLRFTFSGDGGNLKQAEWLCRQAELDPAEWVKIGSVRLRPDVKMTEWSVPSFASAQPIPQSSTRTGRVKVRTAGGSDAMMGGISRAAGVRQAKAPCPERAGQLLTVERRFTGAPEDLCSKIDPHLGQATAEADGSLVWRQSGGEARIVMFGEDRRVKVIGKPNQVRSLVVMIAPYTEAAMAPVAAIATRPQPPKDGRAPSAAYAPSETTTTEGGAPESSGPQAETESAATVNGAPMASPAAAAAAAPQDAGAEGAPASAEGQTRLTEQAFDPQGQGELALAVGDLVIVTHDPEATSSPSPSADRWVYGSSQANDQCGWFPLSHTTQRTQSAPPPP